MVPFSNPTAPRPALIFPRKVMRSKVKASKPEGVGRSLFSQYTNRGAVGSPNTRSLSQPASTCKPQQVVKWLWRSLWSLEVGWSPCKCMEGGPCSRWQCLHMQVNENLVPQVQAQKRNAYTHLLHRSKHRHAMLIRIYYTGHMLSTAS